jgi:superfamily I DNA/RNA helicase
MGAELETSGWGGWLAERLGRGGASANVTKLLEIVGQAVDPREGLSQFLNKLEPVGRDLAREETGGVRLMSMSQSKGLTVNSAIVLGVEEGMVPLDRPGIDVNEERRLLYVAMTRATDFCVFTSSMRRADQLARIGRPNVRAARGRSPLLADLAIGQYEDGPSFVARMEGETTG